MDYRDIPVNLLKGDHKRQDFLAINPDGAVPAIRDGEYCLNEGIAICRYLLESRKIDSPFYPYKDAKAMSLIDTMLQIAVEDFRSKTGPLYLFTVTGPSFLGYPEPTDEQKERYLQLAFKGYDLLEKILEKSDGHFVAGEEITLADFYFFIFTMMIVTTTDAHLNEHIKVSEWYEKMSEIPEVNRVCRRRERMYRLAMFYVNWVLPLTCRCKRFRARRH